MTLPTEPTPSGSIDGVRSGSPAGTRIASYLRERFPLIANGLLILSFYSSNQFLAQAVHRPGEPMRYGAESLAGMLTVLCFFLHMRIFDDHKDYDQDCEHFPDRVLQRGIVSLTELKVVAGLALGTEMVLATLVGQAALVAVLTALLFTLLMLKEFFVGPWLKRHFVLYASAHMLVMPFLALVVWSFSTRQFPWQVSPWFLLYSIVSYFLAFNWEISRKIRAPHDEIEGVDSYTKRFGLYRAANLVLLTRLTASILVIAIAAHLGLSLWFYAVVVTLFLVSGVGHLQFRFRTSSATARRMETYAGIYIIAFDFALAVELARKFGVEFGGGV